MRALTDGVTSSWISRTTAIVGRSTRRDPAAVKDTFTLVSGWTTWTTDESLLRAAAAAEHRSDTRAWSSGSARQQLADLGGELGGVRGIADVAADELDDRSVELGGQGARRPLEHGAA